MDTRWFSAADTAKLVRAALKRGFPGVKFSVRSSTYAGGASIDVSWTDGPLDTDVNPVVKRYAGAGFDGMIDLKYYRSHYLRPDGTTFVAYDGGTLGNAGSVPATDNRDLTAVMPPDVIVAHFGADFIFTHRTVSDWDARHASALDWLYDNCAVVRVNSNGRHSGDMFGNRFVNDLASNLLYNHLIGKPWSDAFDRIYA